MGLLASTVHACHLAGGASMIQNKIVARYQSGQVLKGFTADFLPTKEAFHLTLVDAPGGEKPVTVRIADLKAVFFVKDFKGKPQPYTRRQEFLPEQAVVGRKIRVVFFDGEVMVGTTQGYEPSRPGFFIIPADTDSNNDRCFVVSRATKGVSFL
jgi:hypothetical protein